MIRIISRANSCRSYQGKPGNRVEQREHYRALMRILGGAIRGA
jgi:hypothetical protein